MTPQQLAPACILFINHIFVKKRHLSWKVVLVIRHEDSIFPSLRDLAKDCVELCCGWGDGNSCLVGPVVALLGHV